MAYSRSIVKEKYKPQAKKLLDQVREVMRYHHYSISTEKTYVQWIYSFIVFNDKRNPREMGKNEIERFLSTLVHKFTNVFGK